MIEYKGYVGFFKFDEKTNLFQGRVSNVQSLITFQGKSVETTKKDFQEAVNEYIDWCKKHGKEIENPPQEDNVSNISSLYDT